jgi:hypothetical protein
MTVPVADTLLRQVAHWAYEVSETKVVVTNVASTNTILSARFMADPPKRALQACFQSCTQVGVDLAIPPRGDSTASPPTVLQVTFVYVTKSTMREKSARQSRRRPQSPAGSATEVDSLRRGVPGLDACEAPDALGA